MFGYGLEEIKNQSIRSIVHPDDIERVMKIHKGRLEGNKLPGRYEFKGIRKDGSLFYLEVDVVALKEVGKNVGTRSYLWDITDRRRTEIEVLETMQKLRKTLNGTINAIALTVEARCRRRSKGGQKRQGWRRVENAQPKGLPAFSFAGRGLGFSLDLSNLTSCSDMTSPRR